MFKMPNCIADYFQAVNTRNTDTAVACFVPNAVVRDERQEYQSTSAIRVWIESTTQQYQTKTAITDSVLVDDKTVVTARVSGTFPGSPITLMFHFRVEDGKIATLAIE